MVESLQDVLKRGMNNYELMVKEREKWILKKKRQMKRQKKVWKLKMR